MTIKKNLYLLAALNVVVFIVITLLFFIHSADTRDRISRLINTDQALLLLINDMYANGLQTEQATRNIILNSADDKARSNYKKAVEIFAEAHKDAMSLAGGQMKTTLVEIKALWEDNERLRQECLTLSAQKNLSSASDCIVSKETPKWREVRQRLLNLIAVQRSKFSKVTDDTEIFMSRTRKNLLTIMFLSLTITSGFIYYVGRGINRPLQSIMKTLKGSESDLTVKIPIVGSNEIYALAGIINTNIDNLHQIISTLSTTVRNVSTSANEIYEAVEKQAAITTEQTASISEITSTMEELSASSTQIAEHSQSVAEIAANTLTDSQAGADVTEKTSKNMEEISTDNRRGLNEVLELGKKSKDITRVMEIINNIADNTKLIAFNAALEASGAGEAGKRFGVVAVEIRRLADSVMDSTADIESKITEIQDSVNRLVVASEKSSRAIAEGLGTSTETTKTLAEILEGAHATSDAAREISLSTMQQRTAVEQVVIALREIEDGAKQSAGAINHVHGIAKNLSALSGNLQDIVKKFVLKG
ncbi:MAG: HAMP domain-containing protein [Nitrospirae bacterium]|nr:HAMP domain-containing protein [Nitrospirota bacterium]